MKAYLNETSLSVPGLPWGSASRCQTLFDLRIEILTLIKIKILPPKFPIFIVLGSKFTKKWLHTIWKWYSGVLIGHLLVFGQWNLFFCGVEWTDRCSIPQFTILRTTISKRMAIHCLRFFIFGSRKIIFTYKRFLKFFLGHLEYKYQKVT